MNILSKKTTQLLINFIIPNLKPMKKRSQTVANPVPKPIKASASPSTHKKRNVTTHNDKNPKPKKKIANDYVIIDGTFYSADTKTQRNSVNEFVSRIRTQARIQKSKPTKKFTEEHQEQRLRSQQQSTQIISMQDYVNGLSRDQKIRLLEQLQKQMLTNPQMFLQASQPPPPIRRSLQENEEYHQAEKIQLLNRKIESVKMKLEAKRTKKIQQLKQKFEANEFNAQDYRQKLRMVQKIMQRNMKVISYTQNLFQSILNNDCDHQFLKNTQVQTVIKDLQSFEQIQSPIKEGPFGHQKSDSGQMSIKSDQDFQKLHLDLQKPLQEPTSQKKISIQQPLLISPEKIQVDSQLDKFHCVEESLTKKLKIPLLMTKDKIEELQNEKKVKAALKMKSELDRKIAFQMSEVECDDLKQHFTTLADINGYIVGLYEFIIRTQQQDIGTDLQRIVQRLNFPFGKSVRDKLYLLQQNGEVDENEYYPVLDETFFHQYNKEVTLSIRKIPEEQKMHIRAVFDCFNTHLNAYRPYYELEGEVYPWSISEKGITFYEINEQNIQEVFEKSKIKVLEFASTLCGIIPHGIQTSQSPQLVKQKNQELFLKEERLGVTEEFSKWDIKVINNDVMVRFLLAEEVLLGEVLSAIQDFPNF